MTKKTAVDLIAAILILLWLYAAVSKLLEYDTFKLQLGKSPFISSLAPFVAMALPVVELILVVALIVNKTAQVGLYASFFLLALFTIYIAAVLRFSYHIPCSCGGLISRLGWHGHIWFNVSFMIVAATGIILSNKKSGNVDKKISLMVQ